MMQKRLLTLILFVASTMWTAQVQAVCPVCTVAVSAGMGLSRWLGVDDIISGLWLGGVIVSLILWTLQWIETRNIHFQGRGWVTAFSYYLLILLPLYFGGLIGHPNNVLWGIDKLILGTAIGSVAFYSGAWCYGYLKNKHGGHAYFPFQKVAMPIAPLVVLSLLFFYLLKV